MDDRQRCVFVTLTAAFRMTWTNPPAVLIGDVSACVGDCLLAHSRHTTLGHAWKFRYSASCLSISLQHIFRTKVPAYSAVLNLDKKIREFPLPPQLQSPVQSSELRHDWSEDTPRAMQQYCAICKRESSKRSVVLFLLYLTRYRSPILTQKLLCAGNPSPFCKSTDARIRTFCAGNVPQCLLPYIKSQRIVRNPPCVNQSHLVFLVWSIFFLCTFLQLGLT
jgi:hypothetical protein